MSQAISPLVDRRDPGGRSDSYSIRSQRCRGCLGVCTRRPLRKIKPLRQADLIEFPGYSSIKLSSIIFRQTAWEQVKKNYKWICTCGSSQCLAPEPTSLMSGRDTLWIKAEVIKATLTDALQQAAQWPLSLNLSGGGLTKEQVGGDDAFNDIITFCQNFFAVFPFNIYTIIYEA